jgi:type VI secretion system FHA domain protein
MFEQAPYDGNQKQEVAESGVVDDAGFADEERDVSYSEPFVPLSDDHSNGIDGNFVPPESYTPTAKDSEIPDDLSLQDFFGDHEPSRPPKGDAHVSEQARPLSHDPPKKAAPLLPDQTHHGERKPISKPPSRPTDRAQPIDVAPERPEVDIPQKPPTQKEPPAELLSIFLESAGLADSSFLPEEKASELMQTIGSVFRELIQGLMTVLRGRTELKSRLRVSMTILQPVENNPLKFSPTVDEALKLMLAGKHPGFLDAVDAVHEGYEDIKNHQLAITAGVQAALVNILKRFDPEAFVHKFEEGFVLNKKAKCWDEYVQLYPKIVEDALSDFFGDDFVRAYEEQIEKLRVSQKKPATEK